MATPRSLSRIGLNVVVDAALAALAVPTALWLAVPGEDPFTPAWLPGLGALTLLVAGLPMRLFTQYWRYAGIGDLLSVAGSSLLGAGLFAAALLASGRALPTPSFPVIHAMALLVLLGAPRVGYRLRQRARNNRSNGAQTDPRSVLLVGAEEGTDLFLRALADDPRAGLRVSGIIALSTRQPGRRIHGQPILGTLDEVGAVLSRLRAEGRLPSMLVLTAPELSGQALSELLDAAEREGIPVRRAPRPIAIEELLNRPQVPLDREGMARLLQGRRVLITGAGGTIGSELARQVAALGPEFVVLLDNGEYALWQIDLELSENSPHVKRQAIIADIRDQTRIAGICAAVRPELVFHAAALKHVPMVEANPLEGLLTNAVGTRIVADAARAAGAAVMVLISTDKAVNPTSLMGASKRLAEMYCQGLDIAARKSGAGMRCITVRFGNVLGSTGSVVPLFQRQLERGGPLTVTHPDMQRYFMTVREAVGLVLQASVLGAGNAALPGAEAGGIFVLDMGKPVKIVDLARQMIRLAGLRPDQDVEIRFTGLRPGEKLHEELFHGKEPPVPTGYPGLLMAGLRTADPAIVGRALDEIAAACRAGQTGLALSILGRMVEEFAHNAQAAPLNAPPLR